MDKKQTMSDMVMDTAADLTTSKVVENRRSCKPQSVLTKSASPSTTIATTWAIFLPKLERTHKKKKKKKKHPVIKDLCKSNLKNNV